MTYDFAAATEFRSKLRDNVRGALDRRGRRSTLGEHSHRGENRQVFRHRLRSGVRHSRRPADSRAGPVPTDGSDFGPVAAVPRAKSFRHNDEERFECFEAQEETDPGLFGGFHARATGLERKAEPAVARRRRATQRCMAILLFFNMMLVLIILLYCQNLWFLITKSYTFEMISKLHDS